MGLLQKLARYFQHENKKALNSPLHDTGKHRNPRDTVAYMSAQAEYGQITHSFAQTSRDPYDREFEFRLLRARSEPMEIVKFENEARTAARVKDGTGETEYTVTENSCECEDFRKRKKPCKHMLFLAIKTGRYLRYEIEPCERECAETNRDGKFVPLYWRYYQGPPMGMGYNNFCCFQVEGRAYGISEKTGKPTNRKKVVYVNAVNVYDAKRAAEKEGAMQPYAKIERLDTPPSYEQYRYLHGAGIPAPYFINALDMSALLTRYEEQDDERCPNYLFKLATKLRVSVSRFQSPRSVKSCIWAKIPKEKKVAAFCYAVYCREKNREFGDTTVGIDDAVFQDFQATEQEWSYILDIQEFGWRPLHRNANAYKSAVAFLRRKNML